MSSKGRWLLWASSVAIVGLLIALRAPIAARLSLWWHAVATLGDRADVTAARDPHTKGAGDRPIPGGGSGSSVRGESWKRRAAAPGTLPTIDSEAHAATLVEAGTRWIAVGGGSLPENNQWSLEADLELASRVLGDKGAIFYAGGPGTRSVQVQAEGHAAKVDPLMQELANIFNPRGGRDATYRRTRLSPRGQATRAIVLDAIDAALSTAKGPLTLFFSAHGDKGNAPRDNALLMWGGEPSTVRDLGTVLDEAPTKEQVRIIVASCFSGGFAELVFRGGDGDGDGQTATPSAAPTPRCGLFATVWDQESTGCDPNPNRQAHEGYAVFMWNALMGRDEDGKPLSLQVLDLNHDGRVSLLEAHTRVRLAARTIDVPTTTSERWLRAKAPKSGPSVRVELVEDEAVILALGQALGIGPDERHDGAAVQALIDATNEQIEEAVQELMAMTQAEDELYATIGAALLSRWPVLDDPWHPQFQSLVSESRSDIEEFLRTSAEERAERAHLDEMEITQFRLADLEAKRAPMQRLVRAIENIELAGRLKAKGGSDWAYYEQLLACERGAP